MRKIYLILYLLFLFSCTSIQETEKSNHTKASKETNKKTVFSDLQVSAYGRPSKLAYEIPAIQMQSSLENARKIALQKLEKSIMEIMGKDKEKQEINERLYEYLYSLKSKKIEWDDNYNCYILYKIKKNELQSILIN